MTKMVTRTVKQALARFTCVDIDAMEKKELEFSFSASLTDETEILKSVKAENETETLIIRSIVPDSIERTETLYGMTESDFLRYAKKMENRFKMEAETETE